jgi:hypothetical protein
MLKTLHRRVVGQREPVENLAGGFRRVNRRARTRPLVLFGLTGHVSWQSPFFQSGRSETAPAGFVFGPYLGTSAALEKRTKKNEATCIFCARGLRYGGNRIF